MVYKRLQPFFFLAPPAPPPFPPFVVCEQTTDVRASSNTFFNPCRVKAEHSKYYKTNESPALENDM